MLLAAPVAKEKSEGELPMASEEAGVVRSKDMRWSNPWG